MIKHDKVIMLPVQEIGVGNQNYRLETVIFIMSTSETTAKSISIVNS